MNLNPCRLWRALKPIEKYTFVLSLFTAILAIVAILQLSMFITSERAVLAVDKIVVKYWSSQVGVSIDVRNGGRSRAFVVKTEIDAILLPPHAVPPRQPQYLSRESYFRGPIASNGSVEVVAGAVLVTDAIGNETTWSESEYNNITYGEDSFYLFGYVEYGDFFNRISGTSKVGYCMRYDRNLSYGTANLVPCRGLDLYVYVE